MEVEHPQTRRPSRRTAPIVLGGGAVCLSIAIVVVLTTTGSGGGPPDDPWEAAATPGAAETHITRAGADPEQSDALARAPAVEPPSEPEEPLRIEPVPFPLCLEAVGSPGGPCVAAFDRLAQELFQSRYLDDNPEMARLALRLDATEDERRQLGDGLRAFQRDKGIEVSGCPDEATLRAAGVSLVVCGGGGRELPPPSQRSAPRSSPPVEPPPVGAEPAGCWAAMWNRGLDCARSLGALLDVAIGEGGISPRLLEMCDEAGWSSEDCASILVDLTPAVSAWQRARDVSETGCPTAATFQAARVGVPTRCLGD